MASNGRHEKIDEFFFEEFKSEYEALAASEAVGDMRVSQFMTTASTLISAFGIANLLVPALENDNISAIATSIPARQYKKYY